MVEIIPSINVPIFEEAREKIRKVEPHVLWCHFDITDGVFSKYLTWRNAADLEKLNTRLRFETHLMVAEPEKMVDQWLVRPIKRIIVHLEATEKFSEIIQKCRAVKIEIGLAIKPDTPVEELKPWFGKVDLVQLLTVNPGPSGQKMADNTLEKIQFVRYACPLCPIEIDGGINFETAPQVVKAGATHLVAGSVIFSSEHIGQAIQKLKSV